MRYILLLLVLLVSSFSYAQEDSESVDTENIEEVVTSALRKDTALQDTGLAVTVIICVRYRIEELEGIL